MKNIDRHIPQYLMEARRELNDLLFDYYGSKPISHEVPHSFETRTEILLKGEKVKFGLFYIDPAYARSAETVFHSHDLFKMVYVYKGGLTLNFDDGSTCRQLQNEVSFISVNAKHSVRIIYPDDIVFTMFLSKEFVEKNVLLLLESNKIFLGFFLNSLYGVGGDINYIKFASSEVISTIILDMIVEYSEKKVFYEDILFAKMLQLLSEFARQYYDASIDNDPIIERLHNVPKTSVASEILSYIVSNFATATTETVAARFGYSTRQLTRLLRLVTDKSFSQIVNEVKIKNACIYLKQSNLPLSSIVSILGFCDNSYFYKVFKDVMGVPFSEYNKDMPSEGI